MKEVELPKVFETKYNPVLIARAVLSIMSKLRQPYGSNKMAGMRSSAHYHGARHYRYTMMNREMARIPRIHGNVGYMSMRARNAPQAVKGRKAHPPKSEKIWTENINKKEKQLSVKSALAATAKMGLVALRGHKIDSNPRIIVNDFEKLDKTKKAYDIMKKIGLDKELERCAKKKVRAGRGTMRGRKYKKKIGPLVIVSKSCPASKAVRNIAGVDIVTVSGINTMLLAPGCQAGRAVVMTENAMNEIEKKFK